MLEKSFDLSVRKTMGNRNPLHNGSRDPDYIDTCVASDSCKLSMMF